MLTSDAYIPTGQGSQLFAYAGLQRFVNLWFLLPHRAGDGLADLLIGKQGLRPHSGGVGVIVQLAAQVVKNCHFCRGIEPCLLPNRCLLPHLLAEQLQLQQKLK